MKKLFYSSAYNVQHSEVNEENALNKLEDDIRSQMLGDVRKFVYSERSPLAINPELFYIGGFYYEKEDPNLSSCENVVKMELDEIEEADIIMASLLKYSSIATVTEIVYAAQFPEKEIIIFCDPKITQFEIPYEYWFPILAAKHANNKVQIIYVEKEDEILDYIKDYGRSTMRVVIEGADGVGKTTVVQKLCELGLDCLDREKTEISPCMFPEIPVEKRAEIWGKYLSEHPQDVLVILTMKDQNELMRRICNRGGIIDNYDREAPLYDDLYRKTYEYAKNSHTYNVSFPSALEHMTLIDVSHSSIEDVVLNVCNNIPIAKIVVATNNVGKLRELRKVFPGYLLLGLKDVRIELEVEEDGSTFFANACKKASEIYHHLQVHRPVIADDSGLVIDSLGGFPGVLTHRFLGDGATDEERNAELVRRASGKAARFVCELIYYDGTRFVSGHGEIVGIITSSPRGENGFGFDAIFELPDGRTLAELSSEKKNAMSARRLAAIDLALKLH